MGLQILFNILNGKKKTTDKDFLNWESIPDIMFKDKTLSGDAIKLYGYLGRGVNEDNFNTNGDFRVWNSFKSITEGTGWRPDKIGKLVDELVEHGWISRIDTPVRFHYQNNYFLSVKPEINKELVNRRGKRHHKMSEAAKKRNANKKVTTKKRST